MLQNLLSDRRLSLLIHFYLNNLTNIYQLTSHSIRHHAVQHGDRIVTIDYCDVTSPHVYSVALLSGQILTRQHICYDLVD